MSIPAMRMGTYNEGGMVTGGSRMPVSVSLGRHGGGRWRIKQRDGPWRRWLVVVVVVVVAAVDDGGEGGRLRGGTGDSPKRQASAAKEGGVT